MVHYKYLFHSLKYQVYCDTYNKFFHIPTYLLFWSLLSYLESRERQLYNDVMRLPEIICSIVSKRKWYLTQTNILLLFLRFIFYVKRKSTFGHLLYLWQNLQHCKFCGSAKKINKYSKSFSCATNLDIFFWFLFPLFSIIKASNNNNIYQ